MQADDDPESLDPGLARERTRLAWSRTAIAFAAVGVILLRYQLITGVIVVAAAPLVWGAGRGAGRSTAPGPLSRRLLLVTIIVALVSLLAAVVALLGHAPAGLRHLPPPHG